ncbi:MAG: lipocalin family protein [Flavobacteriaceae bacterium]|jgi:hypothetical protein|nr:lipocalin family protein [Flavobacteriaceae bacterium]
MKKIFLLAVIAIMGLGAVSCSKDDDSTSNFSTDIKGNWKESKIVCLDKDKKVLGEKMASDNDGCGVDAIKFDNKEGVFTYNFKDMVKNECVKREYNVTYYVLLDALITQEKGSSEANPEEFKIVELTKNKLVLFSYEKLDPDSVKDLKYPTGTVYTQSVYVK